MMGIEEQGATLWDRIRAWSRTTFGDSLRTKGLIAHIRKELEEVEANPYDLKEWVDVVLLAYDGFWRHGGVPHEFQKAIEAKFLENKERKWPPPAPDDQPNFHVKEAPAQPPPGSLTADLKVYFEEQRMKVALLESQVETQNTVIDRLTTILDKMTDHIADV